MDSIQLAFEVVFPLFFMMAVGYGVRRAGWVDDASVNAMNRLAFRVFLPILVFLNIYQSNLEKVITKDTMLLIGVVWFCVLLAIGLSMVIFRKKVPDIKKRSVMTQGIYRGNLVLFGIPVAMTMGGSEAVAKAAVLIATVIPLFNFAAVILLERARSGKADVKKMLVQICKNPLIIASVLGICACALQVKLPDFLESPLQSLANVATPLAFVILGASLKLGDFRKNGRVLLIVSLGKLVIVPAIAFTLAVGLGFQGSELIAMIGALASPTAVSSFSMAKEMDVEGELAGQIVAFTSVMSIVTIFLWVTGLGMSGVL